MPPTKLFGGAISCWVPDGFVDVSTLRQVPDNQEVFVAEQGDEAMLSVEVLEYAEVPDSEAARFCFADVADWNEAQSWQLESSTERVGAAEVPLLSRSTLVPVSCVTACVGMQRSVSKFRVHAQDDIRVWLAVVRMPALRADLLVSLSAPVRPLPLAVNGDVLFAAVLSSLDITDPALFA